MKSAFLSAALITSVMARELRMPKPTGPIEGAVNLQGWTPRPTEAPKFRIDLARRAATLSSGEFVGYAAPDNTCGYVDGSLGGIKTCGSGQRCLAAVVSNTGIMGCCSTAEGACVWSGVCVNSRAYFSSSACDHACQQDVNTMKCTQASKPYCYSYRIPDINVGWYSCDSVSSSTFDNFLTTYSGETDQRSWEALYNTLDSSSLPFTYTGQSSSTMTSSMTSTTSTIPPSPTQTKKPTPVGAIVGGVVGGLVVIGAVIIGAIYMIMRNRKRKHNAGNAQAATDPTTGGTGPHNPQQPMMQQPGQHMYPPGQQYPPAAGGMGYGYPPEKNDATATTMQVPPSYSHVQQHDDVIAPSPVGSPLPMSPPMNPNPQQHRPMPVEMGSDEEYRHLNAQGQLIYEVGEGRR